MVAPEPSEEFKSMCRNVNASQSQCENHAWHCAVCGKGLRDDSEGEQVQSIYTFDEIQNVLYPETDHYKCKERYTLSVNVLPLQCQDWTRKQTYLDFLLKRRKEVDRNSCF